MNLMRTWVVSLGVCLWVASSAFAAGVPISEVLYSKAGRMIFGELIEGSLAAKTIIGTIVANPQTRMDRLMMALSEPGMEDVAKGVSERLDRIYGEFEAKSPRRAKDLFRREAPEEAIIPWNEEDRRLLHELVTREFDRGFLEGLNSNSYIASRERFLSAGEGERPETSEKEVASMTPQERAFVFWETQKNAVSTRSAVAVAIQHFEIPLDLVTADIAKRISPELQDALIFKKNGRKYMRWIINPEDTKHYKKLEKWLVSKGADAKKYKLFQGYQTASRSYILVDPTSEGKVVFSAKVSTNNTGGNWTDKLQPFEDAFEARRAVDLVRAQEAIKPFENIVTMDEPAMFGIPEIDQAMLVRVLADLPAGEVTYLPGFSAVHDDLGVRIAHANGSDDPAEFWNEHYNKPLGRALAELAARTGLTFDSPHSQNFLIEMVGVNPTGRIVLRDFGDSYAWADYFVASGQKDFLKRWEPGNIIAGRLHAAVGILHGNEMPSWVTERIYNKWGLDFFKAFDAEFSAITGVSKEELGFYKVMRGGRYFSKDYPTRGKSWIQYLKTLAPKAPEAEAKPVSEGAVHEVVETTEK